ncbi:hypothetical protein Q0Z83_079420 [Actinoplanes sichuanensis]|nr:hypothetical protein Q0Z83_079420 [Actinoplanes sichuanensis]
MPVIPSPPGYPKQAVHSKTSFTPKTPIWYEPKGARPHPCRPVPVPRDERAKLTVPAAARGHPGPPRNSERGDRPEPAAPFIPPVWYRARPWDPPITNDAACS